MGGVSFGSANDDFMEPCDGMMPAELLSVSNALGVRCGAGSGRWACVPLSYSSATLLLLSCLSRQLLAWSPGPVQDCGDARGYARATVGFVGSSRKIMLERQFFDGVLLTWTRNSAAGKQRGNLIEATAQRAGARARDPTVTHAGWLAPLQGTSPDWRRHS
ncbi:hypothetical protein VTI74DRAFT_4208 [Chaetomium olivicolor]